MTTAYNYAKSYLNRGWHIMPLLPEKKIPAVKKGVVAELRQRLPTESELQQWFVAKNYNIGIITGSPSRLLVIDVDDKDKISEIETKYPTALSATTPKGGRHFFFEYDGADIGISQGVIDAGVDTRGEGGYVVAAPSKVKYTDDKYKGTPLENHIGTYEWLAREAPTPIPVGLAEELRRKTPAYSNGAAASGEVLPDGTRVVTVPDGAEDGLALLARIVREGFTAGQHNEEAKDLARTLFRLGLREDAVKQVVATFNAKDVTPLDYRELEATMNSGIGYEKKRKAAQAQEAPAVDVPPFTVETFGGVALSYEEYDIDWLIEEWLPEKAILSLNAPPEHYKTWILLELAVSVAMGNNITPFMGQFKAGGEPQPVLIIQQEDYMGMVIQRLRTIVAGKGGLRINTGDQGDDVGLLPLLNNIHILSEGVLAFDEPDSLDRLEETIIRLGIKLVVIDPLYMLAPSDDFFAGAARKMLALKDIRNRRNCAFVIAHHTRKSGGEGRDKIWGSQLLNGAFEGAWMIDREDGQYSISRSGKFFREKKRYNLTFNINTDPQNTVYSITSEANTGPQLTGKYDQQVLDLLTEQPVATQSEVAAYLTDLTGSNVSSKVAGDALAHLITAGLVEKNNKKFYLAQTDLDGA